MRTVVSESRTIARRPKGSCSQSGSESMADRRGRRVEQTDWTQLSTRSGVGIEDGPKEEGARVGI